MNDEKQPVSNDSRPLLGLGSSEGLGALQDVADAARVLAWAREKPRRPANTAFTAGPERQAAYWHWMVDACYAEAKIRHEDARIYAKAFKECYADHAQ